MKNTSDVSTITQPFSATKSACRYFETYLEHITESQPADEKNYPTILLIANSTAVAKFISDCLPDYRILCTSTIDEHLQQALNQNPALILINVFTPIHEIFNCCKKLKENIKTSVLPVILLIEKSFLDACIKESPANVDDYLIKPFSKGELLLRIRKLLNKQFYFNTSKNKRALSPETPDAKTNIYDTQTLKDPFLKKVLTTIEQQLGMTDFGVEDIASNLFVSRAKLHRKLIQLTGLAPGNLIKIFRLQRAAEFLKEGYSSAETAYKSGFNSPAYFSKCFREYYGLTPLEFYKQKL